MLPIKFTYVLHDQGSDSWLQWRSLGCGASEVVVLAEKCLFKTPHKLYLEKKGLIETEDLGRNPNIRRGNRCEPKVRDYLINHFGKRIEVLCGEDANHPHRKVSFDGVMMVDFKGESKVVPVEIKSPCASIFQDVVDNLEQSENYLHHIWQMQYQMAMLKAPYGHLAFYCEATGRLKLFTVQPDFEMQRKSVELIDNFYYNHIEKDIEPALDPDRDVFVLGDSLKHQWAGMANELKRIKEREAELKKELDSLKAESNLISKNLINFTKGFKKVRAGNIQVTRVKAKDSFDYKSFLESKNITISKSDLDKYSKPKALSFRVSLYKKQELQPQGSTGQNKVSGIKATLKDITNAVSLTL